MSNPNEVGKVFNLTGSGGGSGSIKLERLFCPLIPLPQPQRPETDIIFSKNPKQIFQRLLFASEQFDH